MAGDRADKRDVETAHAETEGAPARASLPPILATRYELKRVIGVGGMGLVYEALDLNLHRLVALKVLKLAPTKPEERADAVSRLVREARAMAALSHKNVVTVHDVGYHEDQVFVAMQLVEGTTMRQWLSAHERSLDQILSVLHDAGSGLAAAHSARLVHRDFKPDNILVSQRGTVRVTDFGLARRSDGLIEPTGIAPDRVSAPGAVMDGDNVDITSVTRSGAIVGTPAYMAPEQAAGGTCDARADQFSFCVTAWEALHGNRPFGGKNWSEIYSSVQRQSYALPAMDRTVPRALGKALKRGLSIDPNERYPSMVELLDVFEDTLRIPVRRRRILAGALAVVAVIVAVIVSRSVGTDRDAPVPAPQPVVVAATPAREALVDPSLPTIDHAQRRMQLSIKTKPEDAPPPIVEKKKRAEPKITPAPKLEIPKPDPRFDTLKAAPAQLAAAQNKRELLDGDLPAAYHDARKALVTALSEGDADRATAAHETAKVEIAKVAIDAGFIKAKFNRVSAIVGKLPKERQDEFSALLREVFSLLDAQSYVLANRKINEIVRRAGK
jgi:Protein kinase domain